MVVHLQLSFEQFCVRRMADGKEETVDGNVIFLFVLLALETDEMSTFNAVFTVETDCVGIV